MEPQFIASDALQTCNDAKPSQSSRIGRLLQMMDEVEQSIAVLDDDELQAVSSRLCRVQDALHRENEVRKRIPEETIDALKQNRLPSLVKLNVGGRLFAASLASLTHVKGTFFDSMFGGKEQHETHCSLACLLHCVVLVLRLLLLSFHGTCRSVASHAGGGRHFFHRPRPEVLRHDTAVPAW